MYHKHLTEGIVIKGMDRGDSNKVLTLLTKEFGLLYVTVQNARSESSKLRYGIQDFTSGNFSLVRGRHSWKLVGAEAKNNFWVDTENDLRLLKVRILYLVKKLAGEEKNEMLYEVVNNVIEFVAEDQNIIKEKEIGAVLKLLKSSGFLKEEISEIENLSKDREKAIEVINHSLKMAGIC